MFGINSTEMEDIKNLIIDLGGVLVNLTRNCCIEAFEALGVENIRDQIVNGFQQKDLFESFEEGIISVKEFHNGIRAWSGKYLSDEQIDEAWVAMLGDLPEYKLRLLLSLQERYRIVLLSNTNEIHWKWIEANDFAYQGLCAQDFFQRIYLSYELHMSKPSLDIFRYVLNDAGFEARETMLIDDSIVNCRAAEQLGMLSYAPRPDEDWSHLFFRDK